MKYSVIVTPDAEKDLRTIYRYIRKHAPLAAGTWVKGARMPINPLSPCPNAPINHKPHLLMAQLCHREVHGIRGTDRILYTMLDGRVFVTSRLLPATGAGKLIPLTQKAASRPRFSATVR